MQQRWKAVRKQTERKGGDSHSHSHSHSGCATTYSGLVQICALLCQHSHYFGMTIASSRVERGPAILLKGPGEKEADPMTRIQYMHGNGKGGGIRGRRWWGWMWCSRNQGQANNERANDGNRRQRVGHVRFFFFKVKSSIGRCRGMERK